MFVMEADHCARGDWPICTTVGYRRVMEATYGSLYIGSQTQGSQSRSGTTYFDQVGSQKDCSDFPIPPHVVCAPSES